MAMQSFGFFFISLGKESLDWFAKFGLASPFEFPGSSEKHLCLLEKHLCFLEKHQVQKKKFHAGFVFFCSQPYNSPFFLERMVVFSTVDFLLLNFLDCVLGIQVECNFVDSYDLVFDFDDFYLQKKGSHGS